eukprot:Gregarina_sp_Pseudo_9__5467@NODE_692_length_2362_cov_6_974171_g654_i0_p2_GENE_NODE_692_length_2362_cov_6_974171_g654_i0NODE_692_length_2362_cov_6_974171_g654_i0_p2_ORF_typecomplete_len335_score50_94Wtap/PF17098_5/3_6e02Wtap/PF17098_5/3_5e14Wtap/PF17098_5/0_51Myosin_tail_1/PF01576_19/0_0091TACC_C/PF05010_14/3_5e03TACC_C/PF05010_14/62TACC_C/PF05010_14/0_016DUF4164/PF13747_6/1_2e02DUF4164/PF13747_6/0_076FlaC_arch/PF05377_11/1_4e02FlaC_arch/PF05377_11/2_1DUF4201/PF13870_6/2_1DUF4201/PF13870_6/3_4IPP
MFHASQNRKPELETWSGVPTSVAGVYVEPDLQQQWSPSPGAIPAAQTEEPSKDISEEASAAAATVSATKSVHNKEHTSDEHVLCHAKMAALQMENLRLRALLSKGVSPLLATEDFNDRDATSDNEPLSESAGFDGDRILIDPAVALEMTQLRARLQASEAELKTLKENVSIMTSFTGEGPLGKRLLEKCRKLLRENEQLGECLIASKLAKKEQHDLFTEEKTKFLMSQLRLLYELNTDLEGECSALSKAINRLAVTNHNLRQEVEKMDSANADLHRRLERLDRSSAAARVPANERSRPAHRGHSPRRRERSVSYEKPASSRDVERRRGGRRGDM